MSISAAGSGIDRLCGDGRPAIDRGYELNAEEEN
jgi:hypothetical protein